MAEKAYEPLTLGETGEVSGIVLNDAHGLCLASQGSGFVATNSAVYTNLVRLSSQLQHSAEASDSSPLITIETDDNIILCKEYHGHCVAATVPLAEGRAPSSDETTEANSSTTA
jgi:hypothetical protein